MAAPSDAVALAYGEDFTGLKVWPGSLLLVKCLMQERARLQGKSVLEVGAGIGLSGMLP
jgi:predicted O-methyltransferase YrrM